MDQLNFKTDEELRQFFHNKKTEMSCMEEPDTFLNQLKDHDLIPEDKYEEVIREKNKQVREQRIYNLLGWFETRRPNKNRLFWKCVFKDHVLQRCPVLQSMKENLFTETENKRNWEEMESSEEEQPGPSSQVVPIKQRNLRMARYSSPLKKGKKDVVRNSLIYDTSLSVTCGKKEGILHPDKLAKGKKCIQVGRRWFTPIEFEESAGKKSCKNWRTSIRCKGTTLKCLIEDGRLKCGKFKRRRARRYPQKKKSR